MASMPIDEIAQTEKTTFSRVERRMFGHGLEWWNEAMLISLGIAAICALAVAFTTTIVVKLQGQAEEDARTAFDQYKIDSDRRIAEANARAAEATEKTEQERLERIKLERKFGPRILDDEQASIFTKAVVDANVNHVIIARVDDMEAAISADSFAKILREAGINVELQSLGTRIPPQYGAAIYDPAGDTGAFITAFRSIGSNIPWVKDPIGVNRATPIILLYTKPFPS